MISFVWLRGILSTLSGRLLGAIAGVALTISLLAAVGAFTASSAASMTKQAIANVSVDWQLLVNHGVGLGDVKKAVAAAAPFTAMQQVHYASVPGFELQSGGTTQTTGAGSVVGVSPTYQRDFPLEVRSLIGKPSGVLLGQQTAANLHARVGDRITIKRNALPAVQARIDGVIDLPNADAFFQAVGLPPGSAPQAPPDNILIIPDRLWHRIFDPQTPVRPDSMQTQLHIRILHDLPGDPLAAYSVVDGRAKSVEAKIAGSGIIGDNLAAKLLGTQADALYARVLFLFLGVPGIVLAILLTIAVTTSGRTRRTREQALLRIRGATSITIMGLSAIEALVVALGGSAVGAAAFLLLHPNPVHSDIRWLFSAVIVGIILAVGAVVVPAFLQMRTNTVRAARSLVGRSAPPLWERLYLDLLFLAIAALAYWQTAASGYQVVLAPEGVPQSTVHYQAFLGPVLFWLGAALLAMRLFRLLLVYAKGAVASLTKPLAGALAPAVASTLSRQSSWMTRALVLVVLAFSFGIATAVFNATYNAQTLVDAELTNGADVTVAGQTSASSLQALGKLRALPGVIEAGGMMHRFAYVGNDLQDLYGINAASIGLVTPMSNAFFGNGDARAALSALSAHPDGVLVSEETVTTYQLHVGDQLKLRLQLLPTHRYVSIPFTFIGISREFPTAPHDSFLITNSSYLARMTRNPAQEYTLLKVADGHIDAVAEQARTVVATIPGARVTTILQAQHAIGSTLTSVDLRGLTALELTFAVVFIAAATGLMLALGLAERRRTFAILTAIGAKPPQLGAFLWSEALAVVAPGAILGIALGIGIALMLVRVLTGVFDPPPEHLVYPWAYLALLITAAIVATGIAVAGAQHLVQASVTRELRRL